MHRNDRLKAIAKFLGRLFGGTSRVIACWVLVCLCLATSCLSQDLSHLYTDQELKDWQQIFSPMVQRGWKEVIQPALTDQEKRILGPIKIDVPLRGREGNPFEFYAQGDTVTIPVLSLKFLHDLEYAHIWLFVNGYDSTTPLDYVSMLKYRTGASFPGKRYPRPFDALGIPHGDLDEPVEDPKASRVFADDFRSAVLFIMAHEISHLLRGHSAAPKEAVKDEEIADIFAADLLKKVGVDTLGAAMYFAFVASWTPTVADFPSLDAYHDYLEHEADHPLTGLRIQMFAAEIYEDPKSLGPGRKKDAVLDVVSTLWDIGTTLDDVKYQQKVADAASHLTLESVAPHAPPK